MKFLFRSNKQSKETSSSTRTAATTSTSTRHNTSTSSLDNHAEARINIREDDMVVAEYDKRHEKKKQQKRRESLVDMEVPLASTTTTTSSTVTSMEKPGRSTSKRLGGESRTRCKRPSDVTSSLTSRTSMASSTLTVTGRTSTHGTLSSPTAASATATGNGNASQPCLFGSHTSLDTDQGTCAPAAAAIAVTPFVLPEEKEVQLQVQSKTPTQPLPLPGQAQAQALPTPLTTFLDTNVTDSVKDHAFQLVPNIHKELGMLHRDFNCVKEATNHFSSLLRCCSSSSSSLKLKPILSIDVEVPGNLHAGRTIFSHPLLVEAIETFFVLVTTTHDTLPQDFHATTRQENNNNTTSATVIRCSKMRGNYVYTRLRILDPITGCDLVPCVNDRRLSLASVLQAMMDALAMVCPEQLLPRYLTNLLEEEQATTHATALHHRRLDLNYYRGATTTTIIDEYDLCHHVHDHHYYHHHHHNSHNYGQPDDTSRAPMAVFGLEHTALGEVVLAELEGVLSTQCAWVIPQLSGSFHGSSTSSLASSLAPPALSRASSEKSTSSTTSHASRNNHHNSSDSNTPTTPDRQAVIFVSYDPQRLSYCTLAKFVVQQHALGRLGRPSCLTFYYTSHEQQVAAQMHTRAHYRHLMAQVDPTNPAQHYYSNNNNTTNNHKAGNTSNETIRIVPLQQRDHKGETLHSHTDRRRHKNGKSNKRRDGGGNSNSSASSTGSSSEDSLFTDAVDNRKNNSKNKTHPGYKVPDYDHVVEHAAAKAAAEAAAAKDMAPRWSFVLKTMCGASLQLQCSKPALRESHLRFVPLTPFQATRANQLVYQGKFHLAMKLLSPRQGMVLMHALRSGGKPKKCIACCSHPSIPQSTAGGTKKPTATKSMASPKPTPAKTSTSTSPTTKAAGTKSTKKTKSPGASKTTLEDGAASSSPKSKEVNVDKKKETSAAPKRGTKPKSSAPTDGDSKSLAAVNRRLRRSSTTDRMGSVRRFPKQTPRMSLNTEAMRKSANAAAESLQQQKGTLQKSDNDAMTVGQSSTTTATIIDPAPPIATIDTSSSSSTEPCGGNASSAAVSKSNIVYNDVVDVPILEAWKAFVVLPEGWTRMDGEGDDDSYLLGMNDVYSQDLDFDRPYYTSDDNYSIGS